MIAIRLDFNSVDADGNVVGLLKNLDQPIGLVVGEEVTAYDADGDACIARVAGVDEKIVRLTLLPDTWHRRANVAVDYGTAAWHTVQAPASVVSNDRNLQLA